MVATTTPATPADGLADWYRLSADDICRRLEVDPAIGLTAAVWLIDATAMEHLLVAIGGGMRGVNLHISPADLVTHLGAEVVDVSVANPSPT